MRYYNATRAAQEIGISYKTLLRRIEEGKITAVKGEDNQFAIAESEVEKHKRQRAQFVHSSPLKSTATSSDQSELLNRVADLERRVAELEKNARDTTSNDQKPLASSGQQKTEVDKSTAKVPQNRPSTRKSTLPDGCILASKFAEQIGIPRETMRDYMLYGLGPGLIGYSTDTIPQKEMIEYSERPKPGRPKEKERYFTPHEQQKALDLLKKHGKLPNV